MIVNPLATVTVLALSWAAPAPTSVKDPAELLPASTLAYAELRQPGKLAKEFAGLFEGSVLANVPDSLARLVPPGQRPPRRGFGELGAFGLLFSPELIKETQRIQGAALALTGFKDGQPEWLAVVLPGESNAPAFVMRAVLATAPVIPAGEVDGVRLYRVVLGGSSGMTKPKSSPPTRTPGLKPPPRTGRPFAAPPAVREEVVFGPTVAMTPNALFIGSPDAVKDALHRAKGNGKGASLAGSKGFREARKEIGNHPGLFAYAEPAPLVELFEKALAVNKGRGPGVGRQEVAALAAVREFINFKAFRSVAYGLSLDRGTLRMSKLVLLNPEEKSPLLELLPSKPVNTALFQFTPPNPVLAAALSNDNGQERWNRIVKLLDGIARIGGHRGKTPSEGIAEAEKALGVDFGKDVFGKITAAAFALGNPLGAPVRRIERQGKGFRTVEIRSEIPAVFVLRVADEAAAQKLVGLAPKVFALGSGMQAEPAVKEIDGRKVSVLGGEGGLSYGRQGSTIVFGPYSGPVAQALANGAKEKGWLADPKVAARLEKEGGPIMLAVARPFTLLMGVTMVRSEGRISGTSSSTPARPGRKPLPALPPGGGKRVAPPPARVVAPTAGEARVKKELAKVLEKEGLLIVRVVRKPDRILSEATLTDLKPIVGRLVDFAILTYVSQDASAAPHSAPAEAAPIERPRKEKREK